MLHVFQAMGGICIELEGQESKKEEQQRARKTKKLRTCFSYLDFCLYKALTVLGNMDSVGRDALIGPSGVRALPLAAGRNIGGHYKWHF
jgi:hypothetical protein